MALDPHLPFTRRQAHAAGITDAQLRGPAYRRLFHGVYVMASHELDLVTWLRGALLVLPQDAVVSHVTALHLYGLLGVGDPWPLHVSTRSVTHTRQKRIRIHQRRAQIGGRLIEAVPVTSPNRTLVDIATKVNLIALVTAAEWMVHRRLTTVQSLSTYADERHLDGVRRVRRAVGLMRDRVESPRETRLRLMIVFARLPEPRCNVDLFDTSGRFLARVDLVYEAWKVVVEYDGWYHERSALQRQNDTHRRERLEAAGWRVIVVASADLDDPRQTVRRVHRALVDRGYRGPAPTFSIVWQRWFAGA